MSLNWVLVSFYGLIVFGLQSSEAMEALVILMACLDLWA